MNRFWPHHFLYDPEPGREADQQKWEAFAQEWEDQYERWINGDDPVCFFDERSPA